MSFKKSLHMGIVKGAAAALCLALATMPLAACGGQSQPAAGDDGATAAATQNVPTDPSLWKTLGDALGSETQAMRSGWNDDYYVTVFRSGDYIVRVVAKIDPATNEKISAVDWSEDDAPAKLREAVADVPLTSVEDVTDQLVPPEELSKLVGKTGQELVDEGWTFESYFMYGGAQTGTVFAKGPLSYGITFDVTTPESAIEDEGKSVMDAVVVEAEFEGASDAATDPTNPDF